MAGSRLFNFGLFAIFSIRSPSIQCEKMGLIHTFEHETAEGFSLGLAQPESKLAVEVDGPPHYLKDVSTGENVLKTGVQRDSKCGSCAALAGSSLTSLSWTGTTSPSQRGDS